MKVENQIIQYLEKKKTAWSETTLKSNEAFLRNYGRVVKESQPKAFLEQLQAEQKNAYTIQTYFIHAGNFYEYLYPTRENVYKTFRKDNRNVFKNAYQTKRLEITYDEAVEKIAAQDDCEEKSACFYLIRTAQRSSEAGLARRGNGVSVSDRATILGKGGKERINLGAGLTGGAGNYYRVYRWLQRVCGLSPHGLRKLALTRAGERGAAAADLCEMAGWSSITTAIRYLQPRRQKLLRGYLD